jgi:hypothetical protein
MGGKLPLGRYRSAMAVTMNGFVLYRAHRLRYALGALLLFPLTILIVWLAYDGVFLGDSEVRGAWLTIPLSGLYFWLDYTLVVKLIWPPELEVSLSGISWSNYAMFQWPATYQWREIDAPEQTWGTHGVSLLQMVVKATGRKLRLAPSHFGATYDEMAAVISAARAGTLISPEQWRTEHPQHPLKHWLLEWGLPVLLVVVIAFALGWFRH